MIARAHIVKVNYEEHKLTVRIPILDGEDGKSGSKDEYLSEASILAIPGININYRVGDTVIVGFEDNNKGRPIVLGYLKSALNDNISDYLEISASTLNVDKKSNLPADTNIGKTSYLKIFQATESTENIS